MKNKTNTVKNRLLLKMGGGTTQAQPFHLQKRSISNFPDSRKNSQRSTSSSITGQTQSTEQPRNHRISDKVERGEKSEEAEMEGKGRSKGKFDSNLMYRECLKAQEEYEEATANIMNNSNNNYELYRRKVSTGSLVVGNPDKKDPPKSNNNKNKNNNYNKSRIKGIRDKEKRTWGKMGGGSVDKRVEKHVEKRIEKRVEKRIEKRVEKGEKGEKRREREYNREVGVPDRPSSSMGFRSLNIHHNNKQNIHQTNKEDKSLTREIGNICKEESMGGTYEIYKSKEESRIHIRDTDNGHDHVNKGKHFQDIDNGHSLEHHVNKGKHFQDIDNGHSLEHHVNKGKHFQDIDNGHGLEHHVNKGKHFQDIDNGHGLSQRRWSVISSNPQFSASIHPTTQSIHEGATKHQHQYIQKDNTYRKGLFQYPNNPNIPQPFSDEKLLSSNSKSSAKLPSDTFYRILFSHTPQPTSTVKKLTYNSDFPEDRFQYNATINTKSIFSKYFRAWRQFLVLNKFGYYIMRQKILFGKTRDINMKSSEYREREKRYLRVKEESAKTNKYSSLNRYEISRKLVPIIKSRLKRYFKYWRQTHRIFDKFRRLVVEEEKKSILSNLKEISRAQKSRIIVQNAFKNPKGGDKRREYTQEVPSINLHLDTKTKSTLPRENSRDTSANLSVQNMGINSMRKHSSRKLIKLFPCPKEEGEDSKRELGAIGRDERENKWEKAIYNRFSEGDDIGDSRYENKSLGSVNMGVNMNMRSRRNKENYKESGKNSPGNHITRLRPVILNEEDSESYLPQTNTKGLESNNIYENQIEQFRTVRYDSPLSETMNNSQSSVLTSQFASPDIDHQFIDHLTSINTNFGVTNLKSHTDYRGMVRRGVTPEAHYSYKNM